MSDTAGKLQQGSIVDGWRQQRDKLRLPGSGARSTRQPEPHAREVHRRRSEQMLKMDSRLPDGAGATQPECARALRQRAFHSSPDGVVRRKGWGACALPCGSQGKLLVVWAKRQRPRAGPRAPGMAGTSSAIGGRKADRDDLVAVLLVAGYPPLTGAPFRTAGLLGLPIDDQPTASAATGLMCLPVGVGGRRSPQIHAVVALTGDEQLGVHLARIDHVLRG
jgi:hypothetical protein